MTGMERLSAMFPGGYPAEWTDAEGTWQGWRLPEGTDAPHAVDLPGGGRAIRDVGLSVVEKPDEKAARERSAAIAARVAAWQKEIATLLAVKPADMTTVQVRRLARLTAKVVLRIGVDADE